MSQAASLPRRIAARLLHELRQALPPTLFFFVGFNVIVLTTNLVLAPYLVAAGDFMLATVAALVVGKAVLVADKMPIIRHFDRAPLIQPILFKTAIYCVAVFIFRLLERFVRYAVIEGHAIADFPTHLAATFSWHRFAAVQLWILVLFLIYTTAAEFCQLFGVEEMRRLFFSYRPSDLQLNRRQRIRELLRLSRLTDLHAIDELRDPSTDAHQRLVDVLRRLAVDRR